LAPFESVYLGHAFSKACQYATSDKKVSFNLQHVSIKYVQTSIQYFIIQPKYLGKGKVEWKKACLVVGLQP
jgi:hypothetical protein